MAKVSCNYIGKIKTMKMEDLVHPIVFVVDMINGFVKEGALSDPAIMDIVDDIQLLLNKVSPSIFICDAHDLNAREFEAFPVHCIKHTEESHVVDELKPYAKRIIYKNSTNAFHTDEIQTFLKDELLQYRDIVIVGCCSDICIMQFALCLNTYLNQQELHHHRVIVPINMIETFHIESVHDAMRYNENACDLMLNNAISVVEMK